MNTFRGSKSDKYLPITEIAKLVRKELKSLFPKWKFSVRTRKFAGGRALDVSFQAGPRHLIREDGSDTSKYAIRCGNAQFNGSPRRGQDDRWYCNGYPITAECAAMIKRIAQVINQWNDWDIDIMTDYHRVSYYTHIDMGQWNKPFEVKQ